MDWNALLINKMRLKDNQEQMHTKYRPLVAQTSVDIHTYTTSKVLKIAKVNNPKATFLQAMSVSNMIQAGHVGGITPTSSEQDDEAAIHRMMTASSTKFNSKKKNRAVSKQKVMNKIETVAVYFKAMISNLTEKQKRYMYLEMKEEFLDMLFVPCMCCSRSKWLKWQLECPAIMIVCLLFYLLCFLWLFYPYQAISSCYSEDYVAYSSAVCVAIKECYIPNMPPIDNFQKYFLFRLVMYGLSPLTLISLSFFSHLRHQNMLHTLTGFPHSMDDYKGLDRQRYTNKGDDAADDDNTTCATCHSWSAIENSECEIITSVIVFVINCVLGVVTLAYDIIFLMYAERVKSHPDTRTEIDQTCSAILHDTSSSFRNGTQNGLQLDKFQLKLAETSYPIIIFNFFYTIWGFFFILYICKHSREQGNNPTTGDLDIEAMMEAEHAIAQTKAAKHEADALHQAKLFHAAAHDHPHLDGAGPFIAAGTATAAAPAVVPSSVHVASTSVRNSSLSVR